jgi:hypothetical protein
MKTQTEKLKKSIREDEHQLKAWSNNGRTIHPKYNHSTNLGDILAIKKKLLEENSLTPEK